MVYGQPLPSAQVSPRVQDCAGVGTAVLHLHLGQFHVRLLLGLDRVQEAMATGCTHLRLGLPFSVGLCVSNKYFLYAARSLLYDEGRHWEQR